MEEKQFLVRVVKKESKRKVSKSDVVTPEHQVVLEGAEFGVKVKVTLKSDTPDELKPFELRQWWRLILKTGQARLEAEEEEEET